MTTKYIDYPCNECGHKRRMINGQWLKEIRLAAKIDQRKFGKLVDSSGPYISDIERNRRQCPDDILKAYLNLMK